MLISIHGENYTGKTTFACSAPYNLAYHEFDIGSFSRVAPRFKTQLDAKQIIVTQYPMPESITRASLGLPTAKITGMRELWEKFCIGFCKDLDNTDMRSIAVDTFSQSYQVSMDTVLQTIQERQERTGKIKDNLGYREQLQRMEYREVNTRMHAVLDEAIKSCACGNTDVIIFVHHMADQYGLVQKGGETEEGVIGRDAKGWKSNGIGAADLVDYTMLFEKGNPKKKHGEGKQDPNKFYATVQKAGEVRSIGGLVIEDPTYIKLQAQVMMASKALGG